MRNERKKQIMTLSILLVAVLVISVGFAAFSTTLKINTNAIVNPNASDFKVVFSSSENALETNPVKASPENMGEDATIENTSVPTISGIVANTKFPGDTVTYTFYVRNEGEYEAFLNSISFKEKSCTPGKGTSFSLITDACNSITTTVSVGNITTTETLTNITGESLLPGESKQVTVTLSYDINGTYIDGPFTVEFGDISMYYATVNGMNEEVENIESLYTGIIYRNSTEKLYIGDNIKYRWCAVVPGVANSCVQNDYFNQIFKSQTECETTLEQIANSGDLDATTQYLIANAVCKQETRPLTYSSNILNINRLYYLKHEVVNNIVTASYACATYIENEITKDVCLRGVEPSYYSSNQSTLRSIERYINTIDYSYATNGKGYCNFDDSSSYCYSNSMELRDFSDGHVYVFVQGFSCNVEKSGISYCGSI